MAKVVGINGGEVADEGGEPPVNTTELEQRCCLQCGWPQFLYFTAEAEEHEGENENAEDREGYLFTQCIGCGDIAGIGIPIWELLDVYEYDPEEHEDE